jgi:glycosyltransferase involved in cell wall biosynthesis
MLANSYYSRESILRNYGLNSFVSYLGVDTGLFRPLNLPREQFVLSVGSCVPDKGFDFLIRSLACIKESLRPDLVLVSNGAIPLWKEYLERLAVSLDVNLRILQLIDDSKLVELYNKARVVLYAPYLEPFGLVPLEAMACGTPVVGVCEGGVRESILHDKTGILADRDESAFAAAVERLLTDEDKQKAMAARAADQIHAMWTQQKAGDRLLAHLETAARCRGNRETA